MSMKKQKNGNDAIAIVSFVASEIWFIVDTSIALVGMKLCQ